MRALGMSDADLLKDSGLEPADLSVPTRMLALWQEQQVLTNALKGSESARLGMDIGINVRISAIGLLGYAMMTAPTLRVGLSIPLSMPALLGTYFDLALDVVGNDACLTATQSRGSSDLEAFLTEVCFGSFKSMVEDILYSEIQLKRVSLSYPATPGMKDQYEAALRCPVIFDQAKSMIVFSLSTLESKLPLSDPLCHQRVLELCHIQHRELVANREWLEHLRGHFSNELRNPPDLDELAKKMHCSTRTLRRRLEVQNTSYRGLLDELRFETAKILLRDTSMSIDSIAESIGFSDGAGLRRAFHRWRGVSPNIFRRLSM
jgi:AraC-like DNA-binding protein